MMQEVLLARLAEDGRTETLKEHLDNVTAWASDFAELFGAGKLAKAAGWYHDAGKAKPAFQAYLFDEHAKRGSVLHSIVGAKLVYDDFVKCLYIAELLANVVTSHHGALQDYLSADGETALLNKLFECHDSVPRADDLDVQAEELLVEFKAVFSIAPDQPFGLSMLTKLIYSCLVDADRLDAYLFESQKTYAIHKPDWNRMLAKLEVHLAEFSIESEMARLRRRVSNDCAKSGVRERGIYKLEVPTGGGKTLASMRFALEHARKHGLDRIIYVIPYLSILSQTAKELRSALGGDGEAILEHHSNILPDNPEYYKLHTDRWDAPVILTTQVQFLESVFSAKGSDLRKLHNMTNSVLIFDEAQITRGSFFALGGIG
ncbi:MAG: CRISPR-associated endonuclease Cas3'' [Peptococcaceae bacterium]|nr:CRISPR-associated endonuclease Cas3'' [Peptococcaceae bacterium]